MSLLAILPFETTLVVCYKTKQIVSDKIYEDVFDWMNT